MFRLLFKAMKVSFIVLLFYGCELTSNKYEYDGFYFGEIKSVYILSTHSSKYNINIQGRLSDEIKIALPYTSTNDNLFIPGYKKEININSSLIKNHNSDLNLIFSYEKQKLKKGKGIIYANIKAKNNISNIDLIQLDPDYLNELLISNIELPFDGTKKKKSFDLKIIGAVKSVSSDNIKSIYIYIPIVSSITNKIWLNNNLGAEYNLWGSPNYNPLQQATSSYDYKAYGSKFQWGRKADGHELTNYYNPFSGKSVYKNTNNIADEPTSPNFILNVENVFDWRLNQNDKLWLEEDNNVCPNGYHVPSQEDFRNEFINKKIDDNFLKLTYSGFRYYISGGLSLLGDFGFYWTNDVLGLGANYLCISKSNYKFYINSRANGFSVRCAKN
jgi:uncharacterized protein (TIGR02145 family)